VHARMTRYEGGAPHAIEETLQAKKGVLPTEFGQTGGMKGVVFLVDRAPHSWLGIGIEGTRTQTSTGGGLTDQLTPFDDVRGRQFALGSAGSDPGRQSDTPGFPISNGQRTGVAVLVRTLPM
jgi:hypothetical protein